MVGFAAISAVSAALGDTFTADLSGKTLPPATSYTAAAKASGTSTITEVDGGYYYWEVNLFGATKFTTVDLVYEGQHLFTLTTEWIEDEIVFYGNFTVDYLKQSLYDKGYGDDALYSEKL